MTEVARARLRKTAHKTEPPRARRYEGFVAGGVRRDGAQSLEGRAASQLLDGRSMRLLGYGARAVRA